MVYIYMVEEAVDFLEKDSPEWGLGGLERLKLHLRTQIITYQDPNQSLVLPYSNPNKLAHYVYQSQVDPNK